MEPRRFTFLSRHDGVRERQGFGRAWETLVYKLMGRTMLVMAILTGITTSNHPVNALQCPADVVVGNSDVARWVPPASNQSPFILISTHNVGDYFPLGTTLVTYTETNFESNTTTSCSFNVTVIRDGSPETSNCPSDIEEKISPGTAPVTVSWTEPTATDPDTSTMATATSTHNPNDLFHVGTARVTYTFTDEQGNMSRCIFTISVIEEEDSAPPIVTNCPDAVKMFAPRDTTDIAVNWDEPNFNDAVDGANLIISQTKSPGSTFTNGDTEVLYIAMDRSYNVVNCMFTVTVIVDEEPPEIDCPSNVVEYVREGMLTAVVTWPTPNATDNSGNVSTDAFPPSGTAFSASVSGQNDEVVVTASDKNGNKANCSFFVNVFVDQQPTVTCPDVTVSTLSREAYANVTWPNVTYEDDYTPATSLRISTTSTHNEPLRVNYDDPPVEVTLTTTDERGNEVTCTFTVDVEDNEDPVWNNCPNNRSVNANPGTNSVRLNLAGPTVSDNSDEVLDVNRPPSSQLFFGGTWPIVYTATDSSGNTGVCEYNLTVIVDEDVPVFDNCPMDMIFNTTQGTNTAEVGWGDITATDNEASGVTITSNLASGTFAIGTYDVVYQAMDASGNTALCEFTVQVVDDENPQFLTCPSNFVVNILEGQADVRVKWTEPTARDNSGTVTVSLATGMSSGSRFTAGQHTIVYDASDKAGNAISTCLFTITVATKTVAETVQLEGEVLMDEVRGTNGVFTGTQRRDNLESDLDDYFRTLTDLSDDFVGISIRSASFDGDNNYLVQFTIYLCNPSYTNEEEIREAFTSGLSSNTFSSSNTIVAGSFDLFVREYRGTFTLHSIVAPGSVVVVFQDCCSDPNSVEYLSLQTEINSHLHRTFQGLSQFLLTRALRFRAGSVVVPFTVTVGESSTATTSAVDAAFNDAVTDGTLELVASGDRTGLYLVVDSSVSVEEVCPGTSYCLNGGTCYVTNHTFIYDFECSCPTGFSADRCERTGGTSVSLRPEVIIGIVCGVLALILLLILICCCCYMFLADNGETVRDPEYGEELHKPIMLLPMDEPEPEQPAIMDRPGPIITEFTDDGPFFHHEDIDHRPPAPLPLPLPHFLPVDPFPPRPHIPRPAPLGPSFMHEVNPPPHQPNPPPYQPNPGRSRFMNLIPERIPRIGRRDHFGPRFRGNERPERVEDMKRRLFDQFNY